MEALMIHPVGMQITVPDVRPTCHIIVNKTIGSHCKPVRQACRSQFRPVSHTRFLRGGLPWMFHMYPFPAGYKVSTSSKYSCFPSHFPTAQILVICCTQACDRSYPLLIRNFHHALHISVRRFHKYLYDHHYHVSTPCRRCIYCKPSQWQPGCHRVRG
ncbi:hypothetical protein BDR07DRAFT_768152 [Suillus spraguei]|nr:hypothetical protein BDR07DRAFT_768152 [Suillus spraguei]